MTSMQNLDISYIYKPLQTEQKRLYGNKRTIRCNTMMVMHGHHENIPI